LWSAIARETGMSVVAGFPERAGDRLYNSAAVIGPEGVRGVYRKAHLYHFERNVFAAGDSGFLVWDTSVGRIGVLICYDLRFAEAVRILLLRGAQILCVPTTWTDRSKAEPWDARGWCGANYLAAGVAYANRMWVACADRAGQDESVRALGGSLLVAPTGYPAAGPAPPASEGARVAICARREDELRQAAEAIRQATGADVFPVVGDMMRWEDVQRCVDAAAAHFGGLDILVNCAGASPGGLILNLAEEDWTLSLQLKFMGYVRCAKAVIPYLLRRGRGRIVNVVGNDGIKPAYWEL